MMWKPGVTFHDQGYVKSLYHILPYILPVLHTLKLSTPCCLHCMLRRLYIFMTNITISKLYTHYPRRISRSKYTLLPLYAMHIIRPMPYLPNQSFAIYLKSLSTRQVSLIIQSNRPTSRSQSLTFVLHSRQSDLHIYTSTFTMPCHACNLSYTLST